MRFVGWLSIRLLFVVAVILITDGSLCAQNVQVSLRAVWGGSTARPYQGSLRISTGSVSVVRPLGMRTESTIDAVSISSQEVAIQSTEHTSYGAADILVTAPAEATLTLKLFPHDSNATVLEQTWSIEDLSQRAISVQLDGIGNRFHLSRTPGDSLRIRVPRPHLVYAPNEPISLECTPYRTALPAGNAKLTVELVRDSDFSVLDESVFQLVLDETGSTKPLGLNRFVAPLAEGVYTFRFRLEQKRRIGNLVANLPSIERSVQWVVVDPQKEPSLPETWRSIQSIDPNERSAWSSFQILRKMGGKSASVNDPASLTDLHWMLPDGRKAFRLRPEQAQVYSLEVEQAGMPHVVVVRVPKGSEMRVAMSVLDVEATGKIETLSLDSALLSPNNPFQSMAISGDMPWQEHRIVFWPKQNRPKLLVYNPHSSLDAAIVEIEVLAGPTKLSNTLANTRPDSNTTTTKADTRLAALHLDKPLLAEAFGGPAASYSATGTPIDDWNTFLTATERLADYCHWAGYNGAILSVMSDGGSLAEFESITTTPRFDSGVHSSAAQDPIRKDVIELMLRIFEREGLRLVLEADFSGPIAKLEENRIQTRWKSRLQGTDPSSLLSDQELYQSSVDGRSLDGQTLSDVQLPVRYSPLDRRFQEVVFQFIAELQKRYGQYDAWEGIALRLGAQSHLQFAGDRWGYSEQKFEAFTKSIQARTPKENSERITLLDGPIANLWLSWRASQWNQFMIEVSQRLRTDSDRSRSTYLLTSGLFEELPSSNYFSDPLRFADETTELMRAHGIDLGVWKESPGLVLLHGESPQPLDSLFEFRWTHASNGENRIENRLMSLSSTGATITQQPQGIRLRNLPLDELYTPGRGGWIFPQSTESGDHARRRLVRRLAYDDCLVLSQGGWLPVMGQENECRDLLQTVSKLPKVKLANLPSIGEDDLDSHLVARYGVEDQTGYLLLVNNAPWPESVELAWHASEHADFEWLSHPPGVSDAIEQHSKLPAKLVIAPYQVLAMRIFDDRCRLENWSHQASEEVRFELRNQLEMLKMRLNQVELHHSGIEQANDGFEMTSTSDGSIPGWTTSQSPKARFTVDNRVSRSGEQSLLIVNSSDQASAWIQSPPLPVPATGRLAVEFHLRFPSNEPAPKMTLTLTGRRSNGSRYRFSVPIDTTMDKPFTSVDAEKTETSSQPWLTRLQPLLHDVVPEDLSEFQVALDVETAGAVWIDDIRLHDLYLLEEEQRAIRTQLFLAMQELEQGKLTHALTLIEGYWSEYLHRFVMLPDSLKNKESESQEIDPTSSTTLKQPPTSNESRSWFQRLREGSRKSRPRR